VPGPGEYRPDATEGITRIDDLPKPNVSLRSRNCRRQACPRCGHSSYRVGTLPGFMGLQDRPIEAA
jgi:hypothetical protein